MLSDEEHAIDYADFRLIPVWPDHVGGFDLGFDPPLILGPGQVIDIPDPRVEELRQTADSDGI